MKVCAIIVLYRQRLDDSSAFKVLSEGDGARALEHLYVWDNSPEPQHDGEIPGLGVPTTYHHDPNNGGLVPAYNWAWREARRRGIDWLLLLDQDSQLPPDYFATFARLAPHFAGDVAAATPHIRVNNRIIAPQRILMGLTGLTGVAEGWSGIAHEEISCINSGTFICIDHLADRGGFSTAFSLDMVDQWFFADMYACGRKAFVLPVTVEHELSVANPDTLSMDRWRNVLRAQAQFYGTVRTRGQEGGAGLLLLYQAATLVHLRAYKMAWINLEWALRVLSNALVGRRRQGGQ